MFQSECLSQNAALPVYIEPVDILTANQGLTGLPLQRNTAAPLLYENINVFRERSISVHEIVKWLPLMRTEWKQNWKTPWIPHFWCSYMERLKNDKQYLSAIAPVGAS